MSGRVRRDPESARAQILAIAEGLLASGGAQAVQVRAVAERMGMTDAGVNHHFGNRKGLLEALLRHGGRRLRAAVDEVVATWTPEDASVAPLVEALAAVYRDGYSELAIALHAAGWRDSGAGMLDPLVEAVHSLRGSSPDGGAPEIAETRLAVAAMHSAMATDPLYGASFRRSAGIKGAAADDPAPHVSWWVDTLSSTLGLGDQRPG